MEKPLKSGSKALKSRLGHLQKLLKASQKRLVKSKALDKTILFIASRQAGEAREGQFAFISWKVSPRRGFQGEAQGRARRKARRTREG